MALRKLFGTSGFNIRDGLDDYDEDFTRYQSLGDTITADMKYQAQRRARLAHEENAPAVTAEDGDASPASASANAPVRWTRTRPMPTIPQPTSAATPQMQNPPATRRSSPMTSAEPRAALSAHTADGQARQHALAALPESLSAGPAGGDSVTYRSAGRALVVGPAAAAAAVAERLRDTLDVYVLLTDGAGDTVEHPDVGTLGARALRAPRAHTSGHLGNFRVTVGTGDAETDLTRPFGLPTSEAFDLVLDLDDPPGLPQQKLPPGYFAPRGAQALEQAVAELSDLVGEFEKPRYFAYRADLCAHGSRGQSGCTRCLDACATGAIGSARDLIEVDPYLCQGCGSCATVCPSGAITYAWPPTETVVDALRRMLRQYRDAGGGQATVLFHDGDTGAAALAAWAEGVPESVLPVAVEDVGAIGIEIWFAGLAYGAGAVYLLVPAATPAAERAATAAQVEHARTILGGMGYSDEHIAMITPEADPHDLGAAEPLLADPATFAGMGGKREVFGHSLRHLHAHAPGPVAPQALASDAPFGAVAVDGDACTLCMACVSVCPPSALIGGGTEPSLLFREDRCVQCGLCAPTCPEDAITLVPRIEYEAHVQPTERVLNEEEMHHCPGCGKAFATRKVIETMEQRLAGHWMFQDETARQRLYLCEDCRVRSAMSDASGITPYR